MATGKKRTPSGSRLPQSVRLEPRGQLKLRGVWVEMPPDMAAAMLGAAATAEPTPLEFAAPALAAVLAGSSAALCTRLSPVAPFALAQLQRLPLDVETSMDPRLQLAVVNRRAGKPSMPVASADGESVPVVARVTSHAAWAEIADVDPGAEIGTAQDGTVIVTGRIPIRKAEAIHQHPDVLSMKASQPVRPLLQDTLESMGVQPGSPAVAGTGGGAGVVVGIVDIGGDFAHLNFREAGGGTRLLALWQQGAPARADSPYGYGRLHGRAEIDAALKKTDPYRTLGYDPGGARTGGSHGTHVMDIAAGNGRGSQLPGVAPAAELVFVEVSARDVAWGGPESVFSSFGDSVQMLEAVKFVFDTAGEKPCVVNLSLGTNGGPHDGSSLVEQGFDALVAQKPNRAIVLAAGNAQEDGVHTMGTVPAGGQLEVAWVLTGGTGGEFELWYGGSERLRAELLGPDGELLASVAPGENFPMGTGNGEIAAFLSSRINDPNNKDNVIGIWLAPNWPDGEVKVRLHALADREVPFHAWIERSDSGQAHFKAPVASHLLGSLSTGRQTVVVGAYDARKSGEPAAGFSSAGPTRDGRPKPEVAAPGMQVMAARSRSEDGLTKKSGTSMAAPAVTGLIALMLAKARKERTSLSIEQIRAKLQEGVKGGASGWDPQLGAGRASGKAI